MRPPACDHTHNTQTCTPTALPKQVTPHTAPSVSALAQRRCGFTKPNVALVCLDLPLRLDSAALRP